MGEDALSALDSPCSRASAATVTLSDDGLRLGGIVLAKADAFDEERLAALLAAAYGDALPHSALAYVKGALAKQREGKRRWCRPVSPSPGCRRSLIRSRRSGDCRQRTG